MESCGGPEASCQGTCDFSSRPVSPDPWSAVKELLADPEAFMMKLPAGRRPPSCVPEAACPRAAGKNVSLFTRAPWISRPPLPGDKQSQGP